MVAFGKVLASAAAESRFPASAFLDYEALKASLYELERLHLREPLEEGAMSLSMTPATNAAGQPQAAEEEDDDDDDDGEDENDGWSSVISGRERAKERQQHTPASAWQTPAELEAEVTDRLQFLMPPGGKGNGPVWAHKFQPPSKSKYWPHPTGGLRSDEWLKAIPGLSDHGPLPKLVEMLSEAGAAGMELGAIARNLGSDALRIDLLKLKAYLTCFPSKIVVAPKIKPPYNGDGAPKRVDQVWLISEP